MQPPPDDPKPKPTYDPNDWPPLEELLKQFTMNEILYGIYSPSEGGVEECLVDTGDMTDDPADSPAPDGASLPGPLPPPKSDSA